MSQPEGNQPKKAPETSETPTPPKAPTPKRPDWKPLGVVRDYFNEQIKQDQGRW